MTLCCPERFRSVTPLLSFSVTEEVKGEKDAGKDLKAAKEEAPKGNGRPPIERPRFMFNIADGGFTGQHSSFTNQKK